MPPLFDQTCFLLGRPGRAAWSDWQQLRYTHTHLCSFPGVGSQFKWQARFQTAHQCPHMNIWFLLLYTMIFPSYIVLYTSLHVRPIEPLPRKMKYPFSAHMAHIVVKMFQDHWLVLRGRTNSSQVFSNIKFPSIGTINPILKGAYKQGLLRTSWYLLWTWH